MADTKEIVENFRVTARHFQNVLDMVEVLDRVGDVERAESEARLRLGQLRDDTAKAEEELEDIKATGKQVRSAAKTAAQQATDEARAKAEQIVASAKDQAQAMIADAAVQSEAAQARAAQADAAAGAATEKAAALRAEIDALETRIARARAKMHEILGS